MKRAFLLVLIVCIGVSGCGHRTPAQPLTSCFSAHLTVTDGDTVYDGQLTVGEHTYEWALTAPPSVAGYRLCCDGTQISLVSDEGEALTAAMGKLPADGIPTVLWCGLFDSNRDPPTVQDGIGLSQGDTPVGRYRLFTDAKSGAPLSLEPLTAAWVAVFDECTFYG